MKMSEPSRRLEQLEQEAFNASMEAERYEHKAKSQRKLAAKLYREAERIADKLRAKANGKRKAKR